MGVFQLYFDQISFEKVTSLKNQFQKLICTLKKISTLETVFLYRNITS